MDSSLPSFLGITYRTEQQQLYVINVLEYTVMTIQWRYQLHIYGVFKAK